MTTYGSRALDLIEQNKGKDKFSFSVNLVCNWLLLLEMICFVCTIVESVIVVCCTIVLLKLEAIRECWTRQILFISNLGTSLIVSILPENAVACKLDS